MGAVEMKAGQEQEQEEETSAVPWSQLEGRRVGTSPALDGSEGPLRAGKHDTLNDVWARFKVNDFLNAAKMTKYSRIVSNLITEQSIYRGKYLEYLPW